MSRTPALALALAALSLLPALAAGVPGPGPGGLLNDPPPPEEPTAGTWRTWFIASGPAMRIAPPPYDAAPAELAELEAMRLARTPSILEKARRFDDGPANRYWVDEHLAALARHPEPPPMAARNLAVFDLAMHDAMVAAWDSKYAYGREGPESLDPTLPAFDPRANPSYPSEHAVAAGVAARVLSWLYPEDAERFDALARDAAESRLWAGVSFRSDVEAGLTLGRAVADRAIAARTRDGTDAGLATYTGPIPAGPCKWTPTPAGHAPPMGVLWNVVKPFLMARADQFRAPPPPACGSAPYTAEFARVYAISRSLTAEEAEWARWWHDHGGLRVAGMFHPLAMDWVVADGLSSPRAARVFALMSAAQSDAFVSVWDSKYVYWTERPIHVIRREWNATWEPLIETPSFPGYPSGHSAQGGSISEVLAHLFPDRAVVARAWGVDDSRAREYAGVHPDFDNKQGLRQGRQVAALYVEWAKTDGAE